MSSDTNLIFTIGHSTHSAETFLSLLRRHDITALADVRSSPFSRFNPQFNKQALKLFLKEHSISYAFLGKELGARSDDPSCYQHGRVQYSRLAKTSLFQAGLERVLRGSDRFRLALMCAEKEPLDCHRTLLVARALAERGQKVMHIHAEGHLESHEDAMERLLGLTGVPKTDLFRSKEELLKEALQKQEAKVAYVDEKQAATILREERK
ncbi:MAG: DUF488 family protein [Verrucomicrobiales bacterium]